MQLWALYWDIVLLLSYLKIELHSKKKALYNEVLIIQTEFVNYLKPLIDEFNEPLRQKYFGPPVIYTRLIENLMVELSGTDEKLASLLIKVPDYSPFQLR